jgi:hypothetical protein
MPLPRHLLRLVAVLAGFAAGFGAGFVLTGEAFADRSIPRCPCCGSRHQVHPVRYHPNPGANTLTAVTQHRYLGTWDPDRDGPAWYCHRCSHGWGSRFAPPGR